MNSKKKIKKLNKRKSKKKQLGGASKINTPIFRCKLQYDNDTNDSELDKFYNNLFKVLLKEGGKNVKTSETITTTTETKEGETKIVREKKTESKNDDKKITSLELYNLIKDNNVLFTELMSRYYNRCISDLEDKKIVPIVLFKNPYLNRSISYAYLQKCVKYLKDYKDNKKKSTKNKILAERLYELLRTKNTKTEKKNLDLFIQSFLTSTEYTNLISHTEKYCELLLIKKIGNLLKNLIMSSQIQIKTKEGSFTNEMYEEKENQKGGYIKDKDIDAKLDKIINEMYKIVTIKKGQIVKNEDEKSNNIKTQKSHKTEISKQIKKFILEDLENEKNIIIFIELYNKFKNRGKDSAENILKLLDKSSWSELVEELSNKNLSTELKNLFELLSKRK